MIKYFTTGYISRYVLIVIIAFIIWIPSFLLPDNYTGVTSYAYNIILNLFGANTLVITIICFLLTIITGFFLNLNAINNGLVGKVSTLPFVLFVFVSSLVIGEYHNNPIIWINFIMIFVWANMMQLPNTKNSIPIVFNASFLVGVASLFFSQLVFLFVLIWMAIFIHRIVSWRNLMVTLIGVTLPYLFLLSWFYFSELLLEESYDLFNSLKFDFSLIYPVDPVSITTLIVVVVLTLISIFGVLGGLNENSINLRRNLLITVIYFVLGLIIIIVFSSSRNNLLLLTIPGVLIMSHWFSKLKNPKWYNVTMVFISILIIINQYIPLLIYWLEI